MPVDLFMERLFSYFSDLLAVERVVMSLFSNGRFC